MRSPLPDRASCAASCAASARAPRLGGALEGGVAPQLKPAGGGFGLLERDLREVVLLAELHSTARRLEVGLLGGSGGILDARDRDLRGFDVAARLLDVVPAGRGGCRGGGGGSEGNGKSRHEGDGCDTAAPGASHRQPLPKLNPDVAEERHGVLRDAVATHFEVQVAAGGGA